MAVAGLTMFGLIVATPEFRTAAADEPRENSKFGDPEAKALALRVHAEAAAFDKLPRFYYRVQAGNGDVESMLDMEDCTLPWLKKALDEPISQERWFQSGETLAWSNRQAFWSTYDRKFKNETRELHGDTSRHDRVWTIGEAFQRDEADDHPTSFVLVQKPERIWERRLIQLAYFRVTPHQFWWGRSSAHGDTISDIPPELAAYRLAGIEQFDDELCDVVESAARAERLWIGRESRRLRGVLVSTLRGGILPEFYKTEFVANMAGKPISSRKEYQDWHAGLSARQKTELLIAWNEKYFGQFGPNELIRFRDYREVAPGVWIPFREDRAFTHPAKDGDKRRKYIHLWVAVQDVKTDVDLTETIEKLQPREGDQVQDQRFGVVVNYKYLRDRTQAELLELVDAERQKLAADAAIVKEMIAPIEELVGKTAPKLPAEGWFGGTVPKVDGKPYLVHFWATWCGPCKNDLPLLKKLAADGLHIIGMHPAGTPADDVAKVINDRELGYPTFLASGKTGDGDRMIGGYPIGLFPYCILVDGEGLVAGHGSLGPELLAKLRALTPGKEKTDRK